MEALTQADLRAKFRLIVISICNGIGIPLVALLTAITILRSNGIHIDIEYTLAAEKNKEANRLNDSILKAHSYPGQVQHLDELEKLPAWIR